MANGLKRAHRSRCERKQGFAYVSVAVRVAREMSRKKGELFMAYECFDCGQWHIAHADNTQKALLPPLNEILSLTEEMIFCPECGAVITKKRLHQLKASQESPTCSKACSVKRSKRGQRGRRAKRRLEERGAEQATNSTALGKEPGDGNTQ